MIIESIKESLEQIKKQGLSGDVYGIVSRRIGYTIEKNEISDISEYEEVGLGIRVKTGKKIGFAYGVPGMEEKAVRKAKELANFQEDIEIDFPETKDNPKVKTFDERINEAMVQDKGLEMALELLEGVDEGVMATEGKVVLYTGSRYIGNTAGTFLEDKGTGAVCYMSASIKVGDRALNAYEHACSTRMDIDYHEVGKKASEKVKSMKDRSELKTGKYDIVLSPTALSQIMCFALFPSFSGEKVRKGSSVFKGKLGERVASEGLNIVDDPTHDWGVGSRRFDDEGIPSSPLKLVDQGVLKNFMYDLKEAEKSDTKTTGNAIRINFKTPPIIGESNLRLLGKTRRTEDLMKDARIYVDDVMGAHTANPSSGDFSVVLNPAWVMDNGEKKGRLDGVLISGNIHEMIKDMEIGTDSVDTYLNIGKAFVMNLPSAYLPSISVSSG